MSRTDAGAAGNGDSDTPAIAGNGTFVAFESQATNLAPAQDADNGEDVYRRSLPSASTLLVDSGSGNIKSGNAEDPSIDDSGQRRRVRLDGDRVRSGRRRPDARTRTSRTS